MQFDDTALNVIFLGYWWLMTMMIFDEARMVDGRL